ncbi:hypothetical protein SAMN05421837_10533 [Amycolatopsis pretoriensis]|uniref:Uncharacterized protein n=1 Tax=Amycolatopsis pretoriensis TaxID=218821 RepID=A0A1H5QVI1_9PSEU|nr:hypothetical protein [Amycolatopsis pretoriensis]SEF30156.1 hypothetical protein SAMN05421837_10533 [Amycolatopsis pretoriensis]
MATTTTHTGPADTTKALEQAATAAKLGPVTVTTLDHPNGDPVLLFELDPASPTKARTLGRWLERIEVDDAIAGKFRSADSCVRLSIRGRWPGGRLIVVATFDEISEPAQAAVIAAEIERQDVPRLVANLIACENPAG